MKLIKHNLLLLCAAVFSVMPKASSQQEKTYGYQELANKKIDAYVNNLMQADKIPGIALAVIKDAIEVFKINVRGNPTTWMAYDNLGEVYLLSQVYDLALVNHKKSLALNPNNITTKKIIDNIPKN